MIKTSAKHNKHNSKKAAKGQNRWKEPRYAKKARLAKLFAPAISKEFSEA